MKFEKIFPLSNKEGIRGLILSILENEFPLRVFEIVNFLRKRYGKKVSFQAVSKELNFLESKEIINRKNKQISINKNWVNELKKEVEELHEKIILSKKTKSEKAGEEINVLTFDSLNEAMIHYYKIIEKWFDNFRKGDYNINCYQFLHLWEVLLHLEKEEKTMAQLKKKGIKSYLLTGSTKLDKNVINFYKKIGAKAKSLDSISEFDKTYSIGTYGDTIIQLKYPKEIIKKIDNFFKKSSSLDKLDLSELSKILKRREKIMMTVIKNLPMAKQINRSIISYFKRE